MGDATVPERFAVYRDEIARPGQPPEPRWSLAPMKGIGYAGHDEPKDALPRGDEPAAATQSAHAGHVEAPDGTTIATMEPPTLDIPGRGRIDLSAVIGATEGDAAELGHLVRWRPGT